MADDVSSLSRSVAALRAQVQRAARHDVESRDDLRSLGDALDRVLLVLPSPFDAGACGAAGIASARMAEAHRELRRAWESSRSPAAAALAERVRRVALELASLIERASDSFRAELLDKVQPLRTPPDEAPRPGCPAPAVLGETVRFGVCAPRRVAPGESFVARFVVYPGGDGAAIAACFDGLGDCPPAGEPVGDAVAAGAGLEVSLCAPGLRVERQECCLRSLAWTGRALLLDFRIEVPAGLALASTVLKFSVSVARVVLARIRLDLAFGGEPGSGGARQYSLGHELARSLFVSYAEADRSRVLERLAALRAATAVEVFLDCRDLNPGPHWQSRIEHEIDSREAFVLFWSRAAANSCWVAWEWERALDTKGSDAMQLQMLDPGLHSPRALSGMPVAEAH